MITQVSNIVMRLYFRKFWSHVDKIYGNQIRKTPENKYEYQMYRKQERKRKSRFGPFNHSLNLLHMKRKRWWKHCSHEEKTPENKVENVMTIFIIWHRKENEKMIKRRKLIRKMHWSRVRTLSKRIHKLASYSLPYLFCISDPDSNNTDSVPFLRFQYSDSIPFSRY